MRAGFLPDGVESVRVTLRKSHRGLPAVRFALVNGWAVEAVPSTNPKEAGLYLFFLKDGRGSHRGCASGLPEAVGRAVALSLGVTAEGTP